MARRHSAQETAAELHRIITMKRANRGAVGRIADRRDIADSTVYDYLSGKILCDHEFIKDAFLATGDPEIRAMLEPEGWVLTAALGNDHARDPEKEIGDVNLASAALLAYLREAQADGRFERDELDKAERLLANLQTQVADLSDMLRQARANRGRLG